MTKNSPRTYRNLVWADVRRRYLAGESAPQLCAEFGISRSALCERARRGKWRRKDVGALDEFPVVATTDPRTAAMEAISRAAIAASTGDEARADRAARLAERLLKTATLLAKDGALDLPCPHCGAKPSETREDRARQDESVTDEIMRRLDRLSEQAIAKGEIDPDDDEDFDWFGDDEED